MIENRFRPQLQQYLIQPLARLLSHYLSANQLTLLALAMGSLAALAIMLDWRITAVILIVLAGYLDIIDGSVARFRHESSNFGTMLDIFCDRLVEVALMTAFVVRDPAMALIGVLMMGTTLLCVTSFLVVGIFTHNDTHKNFFYSPGLIERAEAFIFFGLIAAFPAAGIELGSLYSLLVAWTAFYRLYEFYKHDCQNKA